MVLPAGEGGIINVPERWAAYTGPLVPISPSHAILIETSGAIGLVTVYQGGEILTDYAESWQDVLAFAAQAAIWQGPIVAPQGQVDTYVTTWTCRDGCAHTVTTVRTGPASIVQHAKDVRTLQRIFRPVVVVPAKDKPDAPAGGGSMAKADLSPQGPSPGSPGPTRLLAA